MSDHVAASRWWNTEDGQRRLADERSAVAKHFPGLHFVDGNDREPPRWAGSVSITTAWGSQEPIEVEIVYPGDGYLDGHALPDVFDAKNHFKAHPGKSLGDRHIEDWGPSRPHKFCVTFPFRDEIRLDTADSFSLFLNSVLLYFDKQFVYDFNGGAWPGADDPHGYAAFARVEIDALSTTIENDVANRLSYFVGPIVNERTKSITVNKCQRNQRCPCGSGLKAKRCHGQIVQDAADRLRLKFLPLTQKGYRIRVALG